MIFSSKKQHFFPKNVGKALEKIKKNSKNFILKKTTHFCNTLLNPFFSFISRPKQEAKLYIQNLIEKFGSYSYADDTPLNDQMFERHLYDTIPGAWKMLGKSVIPRQIPPPQAAPIAIRRRSVMPQTSPAFQPTPAEIMASGRVITRRVSMFLEKNVDEINHTEAWSQNSSLKSMATVPNGMKGKKSLVQLHFLKICKFDE